MNMTCDNAHAAGSKALLIAGMHRSGTSAATRVCNLLGVELGPNLLPPSGENPRGFWEHKEILRLHEQVLEQFGSSWDDCRALPRAWHSSPAREPFRERIREIVARDFSRAPLWGLKDPRLCRLLPLWHDVLSLLEIPVFHLIVLRHPLEIAASLTARNGFPHAKGLLLWLRHILELERYSRNQARVFITYDNLLDDWRSVMIAAGARLKITWPVAADAVADEVDAFLAHDLRHHITAHNAESDHDQVPALIERTYQALVALTKTDDCEARASLDESSNELARAGVLYDSALAALQSDRTKLRQDRNSLRARCTELEHEHDRKHSRIQTLDGKLQQARKRIQRLETEAQQASKRVQTLETEAQQASKRVQTLETEAQQASKRSRALAAERAQQARELIRLGHELTRLRTDLAGARRELKDLYESKSWRLTKPLRASQRFISAALRAPGRGLTREINGHDYPARISPENDPAAHLHVDRAWIFDGRLEIEGWAFHETHSLIGGTMFVHQTGRERRISLRLGIARADVHAAWGREHSLHSGFHGIALFRGDPPDKVHIEFETGATEPLRAHVVPQRRLASLTERYQIGHGVNRLWHRDWRYLWDRTLWLRRAKVDEVVLALGAVYEFADDSGGHLHVDKAWVAHGRLEVAGWVFHDERRVTGGVIEFDDAWGERRAPLRIGIRRGDVHSVFGKDNALLSGFRGAVLLNNTPTDVHLEFETTGHTPLRARLKLVESLEPPKPLSANLQTALDLLDRESRTLTPLKTRVDIIVPVYNGLDYLEPLFRSIKRNTCSPYHLIVVDDASSDERVWPHLQALTHEHANCTLLRNKKNRGFVRTVNQAAKRTRGDFVLLNTDVEVPVAWLERLMAPIRTDRTIASTTPFSNAATVCSFPFMGADNPPFADLDVERIDRWFRRLGMDQTAIELPTGIGFCMGVNGDVWRRIGAFDARTFGRGYGEENDWCLRAKAAGYFNVMVPNLFVHHKHGGSFDPAERGALRERNLRKVIARHPHYPHLVQVFVREDPPGLIRQLMTMLIACGETSQPPLLIVDHEMGGGANAYRQRLVQERLAADQPVLLLGTRRGSTSSPERIRLRCLYRDADVSFEIDQLSALESLFADYHVPLAGIFYNNGISFSRPTALLDTLHRLKFATGACLTAAIHDFYPLCPSYNLLNSQGMYCDLPEIDTCHKCLPDNQYAANPENAEIEDWRRTWHALLKLADEILCFSNDSRRHVKKVYPECAAKIQVRPHELNVRFERRPGINSKGPLHIGVVGAISYAKGSEIVADLAQHLWATDSQARITVIGLLNHASQSPNLTVTGPYKPESLPDLIERHGINVFFLPSIWPETFSYVTAELMALDVPIACFDIGAPAERLFSYRHGHLLPPDYQTDMRQLTRCLNQLKTGDRTGKDVKASDSRSLVVSQSRVRRG